MKTLGWYATNSPCSLSRVVWLSSWVLSSVRTADRVARILSTQYPPSVVKLDYYNRARLLAISASTIQFRCLLLRIVRVKIY